MSHHLDTPLASQSGQLFIDDLYVFNGERGTVFVMDVNSTITGPDITYGFHAEGRYEFRVHFDGAAVEALTYRLTFGQADADGRQAMMLHALTGAEAGDDAATGNLVLEGRTGEVASNDTMRLWAGRIQDPFYIDLNQLATVIEVIKNGTELDRSLWRPENAANSFAGTTVDSIVLEFANEQLRGATQIGVWCTTKLATDTGGWRQINRAGHPMMWPIFWPSDTDFSDPANFRHPSEDLRGAGREIATAVANAVAANGTAPDPDGYGRSVAEAIFPDLLTYRVGTPANFGFAARNGRTMFDNAPEVMFSLVLNTGMTSGLTPDGTEDARSATFPYVVPAP
jgi:Domain of unknown function (DUF4331)